MKTVGSVLVIEHMAKREMTLPTKRWRIAERRTGPRGMLSEGWGLIAKDMTLARAQHVLRHERALRAFKPVETVQQDRLTL